MTVATLSTEEKVVTAEALILSEFADARLSNLRSPVITCSFQAEGMVLLHIVRRHIPDIPVLFLDTGYHFPEVLAYRDRLAAAWQMNLINLYPEQTVAEQESLFGILNQSDPSRCCAMRKVGPLFAALENYGVWLSGLRRDQAKTRNNIREADNFTLPTGTVLRKLSPLIDWTTREVWTYAHENSIPLLDLYDRGYTSIGCEPCTALPSDPDDPRSGRWGGKKTECGIHLQFPVPASQFDYRAQQPS